MNDRDLFWAVMLHGAVFCIVLAGVGVASGNVFAMQMAVLASGGAYVAQVLAHYLAYFPTRPLRYFAHAVWLVAIAAGATGVLSVLMG